MNHVLTNLATLGIGGSLVSIFRLRSAPSLFSKLTILLAFSLLAGCSNLETKSPKPSASKSEQIKIDRLIQTMTLREKIGQMIMTSVVGREMNPRLQKFLTDLKPGGITLFGFNVRSPSQLRKFNRSIYRTLSSVPPFLAIDQEGGEVVRIHQDIADIPGNMALGATRSASLARQAGATLGHGLAAFGFNMNLAPVLDVNTNPVNPVIGTRSFSSNPRLVGELGSVFISGLQSRGVIAVGKHFPGHGDTAGDSHHLLPTLALNRQQLRNRELVPFERTMNHGGNLGVVMTAHIALPSLHGGKSIPATLSKIVLTDILRGDMGYRGIVMTDGLEMKGLLKISGSMAKASVLAVLAGADIVSINADATSAYRIRNALERAVRSGRISTHRIEESVRRILLTKARFGVLAGPPEISAPSARQQKRYDAVAYTISARAATLVKNNNNLLPIRNGKYHRILVIGPKQFVHRIKQGISGVSVDSISVQKSDKRINRVLGRLAKLKRKPDMIVIAVSGRKDLPIVRAVRRLKKPVAIIGMGSPYILSRMRWTQAFLCMYSRTRFSYLAAADVIVGKVIPTGRLPIVIPGVYPLGHSLSYQTRNETIKQTSYSHTSISRINAESVFR